MLTVEQIAERLGPVLRKHNVRKTILFGSHARNEATRHSDIDLLIIMDTARRFLDRYDGFLVELTNAAAGPAVEPLIYTPAEFAVMRDRPFVSKALDHGITIYERNETSS